MAEMELSQQEADTLLGMEKLRVDDTEWRFPGPGDKVAIPLLSADKREGFILDVTRASVN